jgi:hypothetical protein
VTPLDHVLRVGRIFDSIGVTWVLGGSMASSIVGEPRFTMDIDVAVELDVEHVAALLDAVGSDYYVDESMVFEAVESRSSFNLVHLGSAMKIDVFVLSDDELDQRQLRGRERIEVGFGEAIWIGAPSDQVLRKLRWYDEGSGASDRQWRDVVAILRVQGRRIDPVQLLADARPLGLADLVARALADAGVPPDELASDG